MIKKLYFPILFTIILFPPPKLSAENLNIRSNPPNASFYLDGRPLGKTPLTLNLRPGKYHLELRRRGFLTWTSYIILPPQAELLLKISLEKKDSEKYFDTADKIDIQRQTTDDNLPEKGIGMLILRSKPSSAAVWIDKKFLGYTPLIANYPPGNYILIFRKRGFLPAEKKISLRAGESLKIKAKLSPGKDGTSRTSESRREEIGGYSVQLIILSTPRADVFLNGKKFGRTPLLSAGIKAGKYTLTIRRKGYHPYRTEIELRRGEKLKISVKLKKK